MDIIKTGNLCSSKNTVEKIKRARQRLGENICKTYLTKDLYPVYRIFMTIKRQKKSVKNGQKICTNSSPKKTHEWQISTLRKCKLSPQWGMYHYTLTRMAKMRKTENTESCWGTGTLLYHWWRSEMVWPLWDRAGWFLVKLNIPLPYVFTQEKWKHISTLRLVDKCSYVHNCFIHMRQKLEKSQMSIT